MKPCPEPLASIFRAAGVGAPVTEFQFHPRRKWRADYAWPEPEHKLLLEIEGGVWAQKHGKKSRHFYGKGALRDKEKYNAAACLGYRVLRCTPQELSSGAAVRLVQCAILLEDPEDG